MKKKALGATVVACTVLCASLWLSVARASTPFALPSWPSTHAVAQTSFGPPPATNLHTVRNDCMTSSGCTQGVVASSTTRSRSSGRLRDLAGLTKGHPPETVDVFGGSMTYGWVDPANDSFVRRAMATFSADTSTVYYYHNYAIPGFTAQLYEKRWPGRYRRIIQRDRPQAVVLAWGLENDMSSRQHDSVRTFGAAMQREIAQALAAHAVVLLVTPPVTMELSTIDRHRVGQYIHEEFRVGASFHSPDVLNVNVYSQMMGYMHMHHQTYRKYYGNSWHPNRAGHILAGHLLSKDLSRHFGEAPIHWRSRQTTLG